MGEPQTHKPGRDHRKLPLFYFHFKKYLFFLFGRAGFQCGTWDPWSSLRHAKSQLQHVGFSSLTRLPALGMQSLSHWTTREVPKSSFQQEVTRARRMNRADGKEFRGIRFKSLLKSQCVPDLRFCIFPLGTLFQWGILVDLITVNWL